MLLAQRPGPRNCGVRLTPGILLNRWTLVIESGAAQSDREISLSTETPARLADSHARTAFIPDAQGTRVMIVSGLRLLRDGLADALRRSPGICVIEAVGDADRARAAIVTHEPGIVLIDIELRDSLSLVRAINAESPAPRVVVFAVSETDSSFLSYIEAGIHGYVARDGSLADLVAAVESVGRGEAIISPKLAASLFQRLADQRRREGGKSPTVKSSLTVREQEILSLIQQGLTNKEIASSLGIELATVKNHVHHVLEKLNVSRRGQAAARAREEQQTPP